jgi:cytochrome c-type biogenesis protein
MMDGYLWGAASALWLGILTSISPCPLATNVVAISYIGKRVGRTRLVLGSGLLYVAGRMLTYLVLGIILVAGLLSIPELSRFLQKYINIFLGPVLILTGIILLGFIRFSTRGTGMGEKMQIRVEGYGVWGAALLGILFALSFCPISAALFFGSLTTLAIKHDSRFLFPLLYGLGTGLPVILFASVIAFGTQAVGRLFNRLTQIELWARRLTGVIFVAVGLYYSLIYIFKVNI